MRHRDDGLTDDVTRTVTLIVRSQRELRLQSLCRGSDNGWDHGTLRVLVHEASKEMVSTSAHLHVFELVEPGILAGA